MIRQSRVLSVALWAVLGAAAALPAAAEFRLERQLALAPGGELIVDADSGSIQVRGVERDGALVVVSSPRDDVEERYELSFDSRDNVARIRAEQRGGVLRRLFSNDDRLEFTIEVPVRTSLALRTAGGAVNVAATEGPATIHTSGGSVRLDSIAGSVAAHTSGGAMSAERVRGDLRLETSGGSIRVSGVDGDLAAETSGGSIHAAGVTGDARLETSGGSIEVRDVGGRVEAHTSGGPVRASFAEGNGSGGSLSSSGGGITAMIDPAVGLEIDAATSGGRVRIDPAVRVDGSVDDDRVRGSLNGGGPALKLRSSGGSIRLRSL